nr:retrovirus-related Pol polyprotein from transposon TNT 1-94 [Tanacetum cinerariifolium]
MIQVRLNVPVRRIRTDNGTEFVNQTLRNYYEEVSISHKTSVARSPQQNGVVERRNRTLIEAGHTILYMNIMRRLASLIKHIFLALHNKMVSLKYEIIRVDLPAPEVLALIAEVVAPELVVSTDSPSSITVGRDAPSPSNFQTTPETQSPVISNDVEKENHDLNDAHKNNDPFFGISIPENYSESSSSDVISTVVYTAAPNSEHVTKWTKDYTLDNIIAMQEELNEFERLKVWELVPRPDKVMVITLKWIYKVKLDELGGILKNKARLVARGYRQEEGIDF